MAQAPNAYHQKNSWSSHNIEPKVTYEFHGLGNREFMDGAAGVNLPRLRLARHATVMSLEQIIPSVKNDGPNNLNDMVFFEKPLSDGFKELNPGTVQSEIYF